MLLTEIILDDEFKALLNGDLFKGQGKTIHLVHSITFSGY